MAKQTKSPPKSDPLPQAGDSTRRMIKAHDEKGMEWIVACIILAVITIWEFFRAYTSGPYMPGTFLVITLIVIAVATYRFREHWKFILRLRQGLKGEQFVGQILDASKEKDDIVFHDIENDRGNIDHVIVSCKGIYTVETKNYSGLPYRRDEMTVKDGIILKNGRPLHKDPTPQARDQARWLKNQLKDDLGKEFTIQSVVVFPGWWIAQHLHNYKGTWILNPKMLPAFIAKQPQSIIAEDVDLISRQIRRYAIKNKTINKA